jgi:acyl carrier protein
MTDQEALDQVREALADIKVPDAATAEPGTTWEQLDVDSLDLVEMIRILEDRNDIEIVDEKLDGVASVGDAVRLIVTLSAQAGAADPA